MNNEFLEIAISTLDSSESSTAEIWKQAEQDYVRGLELRGVSLNELRETDISTDKNHKIVEGFIGQLPLPEATKFQSKDTYWEGFITRQVIFFSGLKSEFTTDNENTAAALQRNVVWHDDSIIDRHGFKGGSDLTYWVPGEGRRNISPLYVIGKDIRTREILVVAPTNYEIIDSKESSTNKKIVTRIDADLEPRTFALKLGREPMKRLSRLTLERHVAPTPDAMQEMYDEQDRQLHVTHTQKDAIVIKNTVLLPLRLTDTDFLRFGVLDTLISMAEEMKKTSVLRQLFQAALE